MKQFKRKALLLMSVPALLLVGCGDDPNAANEKNFTQALNTFYASNPECITLPTTKNDNGFHYIVAIADDSKPLGKQRNESGLKPFLELANLGLLAAEKTELEEKFFSQVKKVPAMGFRLTDKAEPFLHTPSNRTDKFLGTGTGLCYGHREVVEITNFTEPADAMAVKASQVKYSYKISGVADWATKLDSAGGYGFVKTALDKVENANDDLVLSQNGWVHHREFQ